MTPKRIKVKDILLDTPVECDGRQGIAGLFLSFVGVPQAGASPTAADMGRVRIDIDGVAAVNVGGDMIHRMSQLFTSFVTETVVAGVSYEYDWFIPFRNLLNPYDTNALQRAFTLFHSGVNAATVLSGTLSVLGAVVSDSPLYIPGMYEYTELLNTNSYQISVPDLLWMLIAQPGTVPDKVYCVRDGKVMVDASWVELEASTNMVAKVEAATINTGLIEFWTGKNWGASKSQETYLDFVMPAGVPPTVTYLVNHIRQTTYSEQPATPWVPVPTPGQISPVPRRPGLVTPPVTRGMRQTNE